MKAATVAMKCAFTPMNTYSTKLAETDRLQDSVNRDNANTDVLLTNYSPTYCGCFACLHLSGKSNLPD